MRKSNPCGRRAGFTLVEVVVSTGLFAVIVLSAGALFVHGLRIHTGTEEVMKATDILRAEAERMRTFTWATLAGGGAPAFVVPSSAGLLNPSAGRSLTLATSPGGSEANDCANVTLSLRWGPSSNRRERTATFAIYKNGLLIP